MTEEFSRARAADDLTMTCHTKTENIVVIGSENYYDSFWWKMMFVTPGFSIAGGMMLPPYWGAANRTTVLYVPYGYVNHELLPIEFLKDSLDVNLVPLVNIGDLIGYLNERQIDGEVYKIKGLAFVAHGLHDRISLNFWKRPEMPFMKRDVRAISYDVFCPDGRIYSYACRTGVSVDKEDFSSLEEAGPDSSLAQEMADHFQIPVHAYYTRTLFRECIRSPSDAESIIASMVEERKGMEGRVIQISDEHEGLPHPGQGLKHNVKGVSVSIPLVASGQQREGTSEYSLWRKSGARTLPVGSDSPAGLPTHMNVFMPV